MYSFGVASYDSGGPMGPIIPWSPMCALTYSSIAYHNMYKYGERNIYTYVYAYLYT